MKRKDVGQCSHQSELYFRTIKSDKIITAFAQKGFWSGGIRLQLTVLQKWGFKWQTAPPAGIKLRCLSLPASNAWHQSAGWPMAALPFSQIFPDRWEGSLAKVWGWHLGDPWWLPEGVARLLSALRLGPRPSGSQRVRGDQKGSALWYTFSSRQNISTKWDDATILAGCKLADSKLNRPTRLKTCCFTVTAWTWKLVGANHFVFYASVTFHLWRQWNHSKF